MDAEVVIPWAPVDPLGGVLGDLRMRGTFYSRTDGTAPWGVEMPALATCMTFHVITEGSCQLEVDGEVHALNAGDLALVPHGRGHLLRSGPGAAITGRADLLPQDYVAEHYSVLRLGGGGAATRLVCGVLEPERPGAAHLLDLLPPVLLIDAGNAARGGWLSVLLGMITDEVRHDRPGAEAVVTRLADVVVIQAIRGWLETGATGPGWLRALRDPQVGRAVALVHRDPGAPWTLERLAARRGCRGRPSRPGSPSWRASRRCATSPGGACTWPRSSWAAGPGWGRWPVAWATSPRQRSPAPTGG